MAKSLIDLKKEYEKAREDTINNLRLKWEEEAIAEGLTFLEVIGKSQPGEITRRSAPILFRDDAGNAWSGRGQPPKVWPFLYKDDKALPPDRVRELLKAKGWAVDDQAKKSPQKPVLKQSSRTNK